MRTASIALFISILSVSLAAIFIVSADSPSLTIAFYRLLFTTLLIAPFILLKDQYRQEIVTLPRSKVIYMGIIGLVLAAHFALWITSLAHETYKTSVASSVILVTAHPLLVAPFAYFFFKEKFTSKIVIGIVLSLLGVIILISGNFSLQSSTFRGNILAILGGVAAGIYILGGRKMRNSISTLCYVFVVYSIATITLFVLCLYFNSALVTVSTRDFLIIFLMAIISGLFGHTLYNWTLKYVRATLASVALLGEPLSSSILAFLLPWINQTPTEYTLIGGFLILFGIYYLTFLIGNSMGTF